MKLDEIKPLYEGTIPIHITMMLNEVVKAGKVTNTAQYIVLAQLVELFKCAPCSNKHVTDIELPKQGSAISPRYMYENQPSKQLYDDLKALSGEDQVKLAYWCAGALAIIQTNEQDISKWVNPQMGLSAWVSYVSQAQK